jgi:hypothetical protein
MSTPWTRAECEAVLHSPTIGEPAKEKARARLAELDAVASPRQAPGAPAAPPRQAARAAGARIGREVCRKPLDEGLNQTERDFREVLERMREPDATVLAQRMVFRLAPGVSYQPDFAVVLVGGSLWMFEVKGAHTWDDAKDRFKMAAEAFPWWRWTMVRRKKRGEPWEVVYDRGAGATGQLTFAETQTQERG